MRKIPKKEADAQRTEPGDGKDYIPDMEIPLSLAETLQLLNPYIEKNADVNSRSFYVGGDTSLKGQAIYLNGVIDNESLNQHILRPLMESSESKEPIAAGDKKLVDLLTCTSIMVGQVKQSSSFSALVNTIYDGLVVLLFDGSPVAVFIDIHTRQRRPIEEPPGERTTRGPREGFVETLDINLSLLRTRLRDPRLVIQKTMVGRRTRTPVAIAYMEDIADPAMVDSIRERIDRIDVDGISATGYIEQLIEDHPYSPFPQVWNSERPDKLVMNLLEGRIVIMAEGTPLALVVPSVFLEYFQASEDYYERTLVSNYIRYMRYIAFFIAVSFPALYVALVSFHPELLPAKLAITLAQARKQVPFPVAVETLLEEAIMQLVIESGLRLPGSVGQTVGVVAGIIIGQAAISAKLATPGIIIVIAMSTICTFALPSSGLVLAVRLLRIPMILMAACFGLFGFSLGWLLIITHLTGLNSFGVPYLAPLAPMRGDDFKDTLYRTFLWKMNKRPVSNPGGNKQRQARVKGENGQNG